MVFGDDDKLWCETIADRLAGSIPAAYADITKDAVASQLRALEVDVKSVRETGKGPRPGCERAAVAAAAPTAAGCVAETPECVALAQHALTCRNTRRAATAATPPARCDLRCCAVAAETARSAGTETPWGAAPMSWRPQLNVVCGRCGKPRGLVHECVSNSRRRQTVKPKLSFGTCPKCRKPYERQPAHPRLRAEVRLQAAARRQHEKEQRDAGPEEAAAAGPRLHRLRATTTASAPLCVAYKTGWKAGDEAGYERGWQTWLRRSHSRTASPTARETTSKEAPVTHVLIVLGAARRVRRVPARPAGQDMPVVPRVGRARASAATARAAAAPAGGSASAPGSSTARRPRATATSAIRKAKEN